MLVITEKKGNPDMYQITASVTHSSPTQVARTEGIRGDTAHPSYDTRILSLGPRTVRHP